MRRSFLTVVFGLGTSASAIAQCSIGAVITHGVQRTNGNTMQGISIAWAEWGDWWNWTANAYGTTWFTPTGGGSSTAVQTGSSGWHPLQSGDYTNPNAPHWANANVPLDSRGNGFYFGEGWGYFANNCGGGPYPTGHEFASTGWAVTRPTITPPFGGYGTNQWAFWRLNGEPNIDGYVVSAQLVGNPNFTGTISTMTWTGVDKPTKVSLNPSSGNATTTITSQERSDSKTFDVSVVFSIDGFKSEKLWIHINTPVSLYKYSTLDGNHPEGCGYQTKVEYTGLDFWDYGLLKITTNENHETMQPGDNPPTVGWGAVSDDVWIPANPEHWTSDYVFTDKIWARDCGGTWRPQPVGFSGLNSLVEFCTQSIYMGSGTTGKGTLVKSATQSWYTDHGDVN
jgi:hypothetical protein